MRWPQSVLIQDRFGRLGEAGVSELHSHATRIFPLI